MANIGGTAALKDGQKTKTEFLKVSYYYNIFLISIKPNKEILNCKSNTSYSIKFNTGITGLRIYIWKKNSMSFRKQGCIGYFLRGIWKLILKQT